jgi:curved DNA-binding protein
MGGGSGFSDFFESLFGGASFGSGPEGSRQGSSRRASGKGVDHESEITISLEDACSGAVKPLTLTAEGEDGSLVKNSFELKLPKGTRDGAKIKVPGKGGPSRRGGSSGDLYLRVHIAPHPIFRCTERMEEELLYRPSVMARKTT